VSAIVYRDGVVHDAAALAEFAAQSFVATFGHLYPAADLRNYLATAYAVEVVAADLADASVHYKLALREGAIIGYSMWGPLELGAATPGGRELYRLYVDELWLSVWEDNARAQAFYRRYGFEHMGEHTFMVGRVADRDFIWRLYLSSGR
jgi:ribosomal protein S18 acetylase RimI-like enzyme